ncbi:hydrogenase maturation nickel metallochaperone HypA [Paenibacillus sp. YN15]|uniref:hydrogenase maturation nickel metallochaperone HypA/HybF n=1 Tax=Paenibacillus sp. YN15 TaxID=1742774 RepID=UPI000DCB5219|nr:hydrogenase maturation nickel metallochaperone HypA [Paenibacillus sp. YN15]RAV01773.1 hydrogenase maturation nickel metallochaperone HypA [Paenibacillus sp. YN15]
MHELSLMGDVLALVKRDAEARGFAEITRVRLLVGDLSNALPDALEMAFDMYKAEGTAMLASEAQLALELRQARATCVLCGLDYVPERSAAAAMCPVCRFPGGRITEGEEFKVLSYEGR